MCPCRRGRRWNAIWGQRRRWAPSSGQHSTLYILCTMWSVNGRTHDPQQAWPKAEREFGDPAVLGAELRTFARAEGGREDVLPTARALAAAGRMDLLQVRHPKSRYPKHRGPTQITLRLSPFYVASCLLRLRRGARKDFWDQYSRDLSHAALYQQNPGGSWRAAACILPPFNPRWRTLPAAACTHDAYSE